MPGVSPGGQADGPHRGRQHPAAAARASRREPFRYRDYGNLATIGRNAAVVDLASPFGPLRFSGYFAWLFWLFAHIYFLIGFRNRLVVLMDWARRLLEPAALCARRHRHRARRCEQAEP